MSARIYIGRLSNWARDRDIERFLKGFGRVKDISIKNGYCFVDFEDHRDADDAVYELNGRELCGDRVIVEHARGTPRGEDLRRDIDRGVPPSRSGRSGGSSRDGGFNRDKYGPPTRTDYRIVVENLSSRVSWQDLKDLMRQAGEVTYADAHRERKNEGVVEFASHSEMKRAIDKLDNTELQGRKIRLSEDKSARRRRQSRSRSRSPRSRSRSRSKSRSKSKSRSGRRAAKSKSRSRSRSRSRSNSKSHSPSASPRKENGDDSDNE